MQLVLTLKPHQVGVREPKPKGFYYTSLSSYTILVDGLIHPLKVNPGLSLSFDNTEVAFLDLSWDEFTLIRTNDENFHSCEISVAVEFDAKPDEIPFNE